MIRTRKKLSAKLRPQRDASAAAAGSMRKWFEFASQVNGINQLFLTKLDILSEFDEIKVCIGYEFNGKRVHYYDLDSYQLDKVKPIYKIVKGWKEDIRGVRKYKELPAKARAYVETIEKLVETKIDWVANGPEREAVIKK